LNEDFHELLAALVAAGARFLVVGAHAKRATGRLKERADLEALGESDGSGRP
jgi:hypothetical protein